jgi:ArsR family transcriptional regulator
MEDFVAVAKAFADPTRVRILAAIRQRELCVCELCDALSVTQSTLSTHLQVIRDAGLVQTRKQGKWIYYGVNPKSEQLLESVFGFFAPSLKADATVRRDTQKLAQRLKERRNGECCIGFATCAPKRK